MTANSQSAVHFVWLGKTVPAYLESSVRLARKYSGQRVVMIADARLSARFRRAGAEIISIQDFYDETMFRSVAPKISLNHAFRGGFWLKTLERFFVLEQFMGASSADFIFHAELDQLLFRTDILVEHLKTSHDKALFFPFHDSRKATASVMFCNSRQSILSLLNFAFSGGDFMNEMELLVRWASSSPIAAIGLPTLADDNTTKPSRPFGVRVLEPQETGGFADPAELGLWVGGRDPRNLSWDEYPRTKFVYPPERAYLSETKLARLTFRFDHRSGELRVSDSNRPDPDRVFNLHLHAKFHRALWRNDRQLEAFFRRANLPEPSKTPETRRTQLVNLADKIAAQKVGKVQQIFYGAAQALLELFRNPQRSWKILRKRVPAIFLRKGWLVLAQVLSKRISRKDVITGILSGANDSCALPRISGKTVALVGPGFSGTRAQMIDQYDLVARLGYVGDGTSSPNSGERCDLSFLAKWHAADAATRPSGKAESPARPLYLLRHDVEDDVAASLGKRSEVLRFDSSRADALFSKVIPNLAPQVILWLLSLNPRELHVSHIDLMTDPRRPPEYSSNKLKISTDKSWQHPSATIRRSFADFHNPFTHFSFFKKLRTLKNVTYSKELDAIIDRGEGNYRRTIKAVYYSDLAK